jgi:hypothetical protein
MKTVPVFDIETGPAPAEVLARLKPTFTANKTLKDPIKIADDLANKERDWLERAALDATIGRVLCVGWHNGTGADLHVDATETILIRNFWARLSDELNQGGRVAGFYSNSFDLPFLIRRSYILGISVPANLRRGRYFNDNLIDLAELWACGRYEERISLDALSKAMGIGQKNGSGADFAGLLETDREKALEYARNDLDLTWQAAQRMLGIDWKAELESREPKNLPPF